MNKKKLKESLRVSGRTIGISLLIYACILIFRPGFRIIIGALSAFVLVMSYKQIYNAINLARAKQYYSSRKICQKILGQLLQLWIVITIIYVLSWLVGPWGFWGSLLIVFLLAAYRIIRNWREFINGLCDIEREIWGRPMERKYWNDHRPPKLRLVLKKGQQQYTGENMKKNKVRKIRPIPLVLAWISLAAFVLIGALAIVDNIITALFAIHAGVGAGYFTGYILGVLLVVFLAYLLPIVMMVTYIRHARRQIQK